MIGEIKDIKKLVNLKFKDYGDLVYLIGKTDINVDKIGGSLYLKVLEGFVGGEIDFVNSMYERYLQNFILDLIEKGILKSVHDVSKGGLLVALTVSCILSNRGFKGILDTTIEELLERISVGLLCLLVVGILILLSLWQNHPISTLKN